MSATAFDKQAELLETIHRAARELRDLVGDAVEIIVRPPTTPNGKPPVGQVPGSAGAAALRFFRDRPGEWSPVRDVVAVSGHSTSSVAQACAKLVAQGLLEHNGGKTRAGRYRLKTSPGAPARRERNGGAPDLAHAPGGDPAHEGTPAQPAASSAPAAPSLSTEKEQASPELPEIKARVVASLVGEAGTVTELAMRTGLPRRDVQQAIRELIEARRIVTCGERLPLHHTVYGVETDE